MSGASPPPVDGRALAAIVAGMEAVALVDGVADPRELALIASAKATLPYAIDVSRARIATPELRERLVRSLLEVALADGAIVQAERDVIREITRAHGIAPEQVDAIEAELTASSGGLAGPRGGL